jgi:hypothetical protein
MVRSDMRVSMVSRVSRVSRVSIAGRISRVGDANWGITEGQGGFYSP